MDDRTRLGFRQTKVDLLSVLEEETKRSAALLEALDTAFGYLKTEHGLRAEAIQFVRLNDDMFNIRLPDKRSYHPIVHDIGLTTSILAKRVGLTTQNTRLVLSNLYHLSLVGRSGSRYVEYRWAPCWAVIELGRAVKACSERAGRS